MMNLPENNPDKRNANTENSMNMETAFDKEFVDSNTQCELVQDLLPLYVEGLTSPLSSAFIQRHIDQCPKCKAEWDAMRQPIPEIPDVQDIPVKNALKKTGRTLRKNRVIVTVLILLCLVLGIGSGVLFFHGSRLEVQDVYIRSQYQSEDGNSTVLVIAGTSPSIGFVKSQIACDASNENCELTLYGGSGLLSQKETVEVDFPQSVQQITLKGEVIYRDGEIINAMGRYYAPYMNGSPGDTQRMPLCWPNFTVDHRPVSFTMDYTEDPQSRIWIWKTEDCTLNQFSESEVHSWKDRCKIILALTPALQEIRVQDKNGDSLSVSRKDLESLLTEEQIQNGFANEAELQRFLNEISPADPEQIHERSRT